MWDYLESIGVTTKHVTGFEFVRQPTGDVTLTVTRWQNNKYWDEIETEYQVNADGTVSERLRQETDH